MSIRPLIISRNTPAVNPTRLKTNEAIAICKYELGVSNKLTSPRSASPGYFWAPLLGAFAHDVITRVKAYRCSITIIMPPIPSCQLKTTLGPFYPRPLCIRLGYQDMSYSGDHRSNDREGFRDFCTHLES